MKIYFRRYHYVIEILTAVLMLAALVTAIVGIVKFPDGIPCKFDDYGNPTDMTSPVLMLILWLIMLFTNMMSMLFVNLMPPEAANVPFRFSEKNAPQMYADTITLALLVGLIISLWLVLFILFTLLGSDTGQMAVTIGMVVVMTAELAGMIVKMYFTSRRA